VDSLFLVTIVVPDYDEAIAHYCDDLGFELLEDTARPHGGRWVRVRPPGSGGAAILLARADGPEQERAIGQQTGGRVSFFLSTQDFEGDLARLSASGVELEEEPRHEPYGTVVVFRDAFGNRWDLIEPAPI
jgi:catechol 2,3-dioxygenase-like lactoylglutathione lyase family enzyme